MKKYIFYITIYFLGISNCSIAQTNSKQSNEDKLNEMIQKMQDISTNIETNKQKINTTNSPSTKKNTGRKPMKGRSVQLNKSTLDNTFKLLTTAEKEKVKDLPNLPDAFRTNIDAQQFIDGLNGIDLSKRLMENAGGKSMAMVGYLISYQSAKIKADYIVEESAKLKAAFQKLNPNIIFGKEIGKTYTSENALVYLPLGDASFADEVISANYTIGAKEFPAKNCLHTPDYILEKDILNNKGIYSLGLKGSIILKFSDNALVDANGADLFVFEAGEIEPTKVAISKDGNKWLEIGEISGGTASLDIHDFVKPNDYYYYIRLTDLETESGLPGADIDAVATIGSAMHLDLSAEILFDVGKSTVKPEGVSAIVKLSSSLQNLSNAEIIVEGHTDDIGNDEDNKKLSLQRAEAISAILKTNLSTKINFKYKEIGKGKSEPLVPNNSDENRKKNRRVEIIVIPN
jgi:outer membrane protein OmpA-like peptidoglycan-associated protein